jgi:hypothetical protein
MLIIHFISLLIFLLNLQKNYQIRKISLSLLKKIHTSYLLVSFFSNQKKEALAYGLKHDVFIFFLCRVDTQVTKHKLAIKQLIIYFLSFSIDGHDYGCTNLSSTIFLWIPKATELCWKFLSSKCLPCQT